MRNLTRILAILVNLLPIAAAAQTSETFSTYMGGAPAATTPLAGTEPVLVLQGGVAKQVTVSNLPSGALAAGTTVVTGVTSGNCLTVTTGVLSSASCGGGGGSGTVSAGLINQLSWYAASGTTVSGLTTANNGVLVTSAGGVPSISTVLPSGLTISGGIFNGMIGATTPASGSFTTLAASGAVSGAGITSLFASPPAIGGTAAAAGKFTTLQATGTLTTNITGGGTQCLQVANDGSVSATGGACGSGSGAVNSVSNSDGSLTFSPTTGLVVGSLNPAHANTWSAAQTFTQQIASTVGTGTAPFSVASTTNVANLNASSLNGATFAAPGPIGSGTAGTGAFTTLSASGALTTNLTGGGTQCVQVSNTGVLSGTGGACSGGSGTINPGTTGQVATYTGSTAISSQSLTGIIDASIGSTQGNILYRNAASWVVLAPGTAGQVLQTGGAAANPAWATVSGSGTVNAGTINQLAFYASTSSAVSGLATGANGVLVTSGGGVPSIGATLPAAVQSNITGLGTVTAGTWNGGIIAGNFGGSGVNNGATTFTRAGNVTFAGAFPFTGTLTGATTVTFPTTGTLLTSTVITLPSLTSASSLATVGTLTSGATGAGFTVALGTSTVTGILNVPNGGTGNATATAHSIPLNQGTAAQTNTGTGTSGQCLTSNGAAADPSFRGGCRVLLATLTASTSANLTDTTSLTATFNDYEFVFENVLPTANTSQCVFTIQSGGTFKSAGYQWSLSDNNTLTTATAGSFLPCSAATAAGLPTNAGGGGSGWSGTLRVFTPAGSGKTMWSGMWAGIAGNTGATTRIVQLSGGWNTAGATTGFSMQFVGTTIASGTIKIYGML